MNNITINGVKTVANLEREITLNNGALVFLKEKGAVKKVFMVVSFRDNKNVYGNQDTGKYCTLVDLDSGYFPFEERCSRKTTVRRVLNHILRLGKANYSYNRSIEVEKYGDHDIEIHALNNYKLDISI